jgi:peptide-methionine (S)-S-oxide reductase
MPKLETATLGGGCFWCLEAVYRQMDGVLGVESGYTGGHVPNPAYREVCTGETGHVEVVRVTFDPEVTSYREILDVFFALHDPTSKDRQGDDKGPQYRSVIFCHSNEQRETAEQTIRELDASGMWKTPIVTEVRPAAAFYEAEDYHQEYFLKNPEQPYCAYVIAPKVAKFHEKFAGKVKRRRSGAA